MAIIFNCPNKDCGKCFKVPEQYAGKRTKCKYCGTPIQIPMASEAPPVTIATKTTTTSPTQHRPQTLHAMKCESCGGTVEYRNGQGYFECKYCHSKYNATADNQGNSVIQTIELREIAKKVDEVSGELKVTRLQKNAGIIQDKIDFKYVEFFHSSARKAGSAAVVCWIIGGVVLLIGLSQGTFGAMAAGVVIIVIGAALFFLVFKKAQANMQAECEKIRASELEPIFERLRKVGATLEGGDVALGYEESTATPLRYCVSCHKNVTPVKTSGGGGALSGINLALTIITCGAWLPAWIFIAIITKAGSSARRAVSAGACPHDGTTPLFPARIETV